MDSKTHGILEEISNPQVNMSVVKLVKAPKIAVYSIKNELIADETDAVMNVLDYAEIPYTILYDEEVLKDELVMYDWLHLHHEDFTGQHGRFLRRESAVIESKLQEATAHQLGYMKVSQMKLDVAKKIKGFCAGGGYLFAMCSGAETFDIALAANGTDITDSAYDGMSLITMHRQSLISRKPLHLKISPWSQAIVASFQISIQAAQIFLSKALTTLCCLTFQQNGMSYRLCSRKIISMSSGNLQVKQLPSIQIL